MIPGEELDASSAKVVYPRRLSRNDEIKECLSTKGKVRIKHCILLNQNQLPNTGIINSMNRIEP